MLKLLKQPRLGQEYITEFMKYLQWIDQTRGLDSRQVFPEVYADLESLTIDKTIKLD